MSKFRPSVDSIVQNISNSFDADDYESLTQNINFKKNITEIVGYTHSVNYFFLKLCQVLYRVSDSATADTISFLIFENIDNENIKNVQDIVSIGKRVYSMTDAEMHKIAVTQPLFAFKDNNINIDINIDVKSIEDKIGRLFSGILTTGAKTAR